MRDDFRPYIRIEAEKQKGIMDYDEDDRLLKKLILPALRCSTALFITGLIMLGVCAHYDDRLVSFLDGLAFLITFLSFLATAGLIALIFVSTVDAWMNEKRKGDKDDDA